MKKIYFDWSGTKGITVIGDNAKLPTHEESKILKCHKTKIEKEHAKEIFGILNGKIYNDFDELFENLAEPTILIGEATFESFLPVRRKRVIEIAKSLGHKILTTPTRETDRRRRILGLEKSDYVDPFVIRDLANDGKTHLKIPNFVSEDWIEKRETANQKLMIMRNTNVKVNSVKIGLKDYFAKLIVNFLPHLDGYSEETRLILGESGKKYNLVGVAAVGVATQYVNNTREFDRLCGLYHHGYPSQIRSDLYKWRWGKRFTNPDKKNYGKVSLSDFRREHRRLHYWIKNNVDFDYVNSKIKPYMEETVSVDIEKSVEHIRHKSRHYLFFDSLF